MRKPIIAGNWKMNKTPAEAKELIEAGVHVACVRYNNTHHDFMMLNALAETAPTRAAVAQAAAALKKMLL